MENVSSVPTKYTTKEEIIEVIKQGVEQHGDKTNPRSAQEGVTSCVYAKAFPSPTENANCIIGYVALNLGWEVPDESVVQGAGSMARAFRWPVDPATQHWMDAVQAVFDGIQQGKGPDYGRTWQQAYAICIDADWNDERL